MPHQHFQPHLTSRGEREMEGILNFDVKFVIVIINFLISFGSGIGSYFRSIYAIRQELKDSLHANSEKIRDEIRDRYASKEETKFIHESLVEIKNSLRDIRKVMVVNGRRS